MSLASAPARPSAHVFQRATAAAMPMAVGGDGIFILTADGRRVLDASSGAAVSCLGHSDKTVVNAIKAQLDELPFAHTGFFTSEPAEVLASMLVERAPEGIAKVYFVSGGSEAAEAAIKLARQYHLERGEPKRYRVIARRQSYHGNTLGALAAGGNEWRRAPYSPLLTDAMSHIAPCHHYRWAEPGESLEDYGQRVANELETEILRLGAETVSAFMAEPVVGGTMGAVPAAPGYLARIREICDKYGVLLILDEVMCGMGRTGYLFACDEDGVSPDILLIAKGLGAGYQPIGALLTTDAVHDAIAGGSGFFQHGHTYMGHPAACAGSIAVLTAMEERSLLANVSARGDQLQERLCARFGNHPNVGDVRGRGLFVGVELVADRATKVPLPPEAKTHAHIKREAFARDLMTYPMGGTIDGKSGDHILLAPPFIVTEDDVDTIVDRLGEAVEAVIGTA
ncbi:MAG: aspartate aminotransferase family protein [Pseudomonadota bacterium]